LTPLVTVFADTATMLRGPDSQLAYWAAVCGVAETRPWALLQLCNEWNHPTQRIDPQAFRRPSASLACHGSGLTDADPVAPRWDFACYHARRDALPDARGITNYCCYEFQARYPQLCPLIPAEGLKPGDYSWRPEVAALMGAHAGLGAGGIFHTSEGVNGELWDDRTRRCAEAFFGAMA
jgi:hypothetical protein